MKPVLILQHLHADGPAYLETWLDREQRPFRLFNTEAGQAFPDRIRDYAALAVLGGEMSANDPLPSLRAAERLILDAVQADVPVLGHCLGGQLLARALGAPVTEASAPEIGWHPVEFAATQDASAWFGDARDAVVFQWHYDMFGLPSGAVALAGSDACPVQAFGLGPHLAMQFHVELDATKLRAWTESHDERLLAVAAVPTVQSGAAMRAGASRHLVVQQALADRIYQRWMALADQRA
jgi:GMP synthase (glutamine-hydrolysing)